MKWPNRSPCERRETKNACVASTQAFPRAKRESRLLRGELAGFLGGEIAIHHGAAARAQIGAMLDHAGRDFRNVRDFRAAEAKCIAGAHLLRFRAEGEACG